MPTGHAPVPSRQSEGVARARSHSLPARTCWDLRGLSPALPPPPKAHLGRHHLPPWSPLCSRSMCVSRASYNWGPRGLQTLTGSGLHCRSSCPLPWLPRRVSVPLRQGGGGLDHSTARCMRPPLRDLTAATELPPGSTEPQRLPEALTQPPTSTLQPCAHEDPPRGPPDPRAPPLRNRADARLC